MSSTTSPVRRLAVLASTLLAASVAMIAPAADARAGTVATGASAAVRYGQQHHMTSGIAVIDTKTGALYAAGSSTRRYPAASVAKTMIAARLLLTGQMHGHNASVAWFMITQSDNASAYALYGKVGRDGLLPWLAKHYRIKDLGARPTMPGHYGSTQITARGMARFYAAIRKDHKVWPWLSRAMHAYHRRSSADEPNDFGIAAAAPASAVKNGWVTGRDTHAMSAAIINTTGFVDHDRYAAVILSEGPGSLYYAAGERIVSHEAKLVMPRGRITPIPAPTIRALSAVSGATKGGARITVTGTGFTSATAVRFGTRAGHSVSVVSPTKLRVTVPAHPAGRIFVRASNVYGTSRAHLPQQFTYVAATPVTP